MKSVAAGIAGLPPHNFAGRAGGVGGGLVVANEILPLLSLCYDHECVCLCVGGGGGDGGGGEGGGGGGLRNTGGALSY